MARFLLLVTPTPAGCGEISAAGQGRRTAEFIEWVDSLARARTLVAGGRLLPNGRRIVRDRQGHHTASDETAGAAVVGAFLLVEQPDHAAALALASGCPAGAPGCVDLFEVDDPSRETP